MERISKVPTLTPDIALTWSEARIAQMAESVRALPPENFVHWTQQAELHAARGDNALARSCIEHAIETWGQHHANNHHFFTEIAVAALVVGHYDLVYEIVDQHLRPDWRFEIQIVEGIFKVPYVIEWEIVSRTRSI